MEESQTTQMPVAPTVNQTQFTAEAPVVTPPQPPASPSESLGGPTAPQPEKSGSGGFLVMLLVVAILLTLVAAGAYYWYTTQVSVTPKATSTQVLPTAQPTQSLENLESDANNLQIEDLEQDFATIDSDLTNL